MKYLIITFFIFLLSARAFAANAFLDSLMKRQESKSKSRWTVSDWLSQKQRVNLMDMWLAANTKGQIFEVYLSGSYNSYTNEDLSGAIVIPADGNFTRANLGVFVTLLGLEYQNVQDQGADLSSETGLFKLRILGAVDQGTNLTLHYGIRETSEKISTLVYKQEYYGASIQMYILKFLGLRALYSDIQPVLLSNGKKVEAIRSEGGIFFELGLLQIFANAYNETSKYSDGKQLAQKGVETGIKLYF